MPLLLVPYASPTPSLVALALAPVRSRHPMQTKAKSCIFKPRMLTAAASPIHQEPSSVSEALSLPHWLPSMGLEYDALLRNNTWEIVPSHPTQTIVHNKWIFRTKVKDDGTLGRYKARLVAKGFQQTLGVDFFDTFNLVVKASTIRIILTIAVTRQWEIHHIDVNNTFLNGDLQETVFMAQPEGFVDPSKPTHVCCLRKALYGLKQALRAWFDKRKFTLHRWGF